MKSEILQIAVPIICAVIVALTGWQARQNKQLRKRLRRALEECAQFYKLEDLYCESIVALSWHKTPLAVKRWVRSVQRSREIQTPTLSSQGIARELTNL
jgi:hypothetical protein